MKILDAVLQCQKVLPKYTNLFNDEIIISSISKSSGIVTVHTSIPHKFKTGDNIKIIGCLVANLITGWVDNDDGTITFTTSDDHDLTQGVSEKVRLNYANYNGLFNLIAVPDGNSFTIAYIEDPDIDGGSLIEERIDGYNGFFTITVPEGSTDTFTYSLGGTEQPALLENPKAIGAFRIAGITDIDRVLKYYEQNSGTSEHWLYIIKDSCQGSFSRDTSTDAMARFTKQDDYQQELYQRFHVIVVVPTSSQMVGIEASDLMEDIRTWLCKTLVGVFFPTSFSTNQRYRTNYVRDNFFNYIGSLYMHDFVFETLDVLSESDIVEPDDSRALRGITVNNAFEFDNFADIERKNTEIINL